jgi:Lrp/AsnC family transcriptional regulator for asnA, asnC and gidA
LIIGQKPNQAMQLDTIDEAIVRLLQEDGRRPVSEMARLVGVAEQTVRNRVERMISNNVFDVMAILNPAAVGFTKDVLINLRVRPDRVLEIGDALAAMDNVSYVGFLSGSYDLMIEVVLRDDEELFRFITVDLYQIDGIQQAETWTVLHTRKWAHGWARPLPENGLGLTETQRSGARGKAGGR